jgi:putative oxidoreductase
MRLGIGVALIAHGVTRLLSGPTIEPAILLVLAVGAGLSLLAGLWTPIAGTLVAIIEVWTIFSGSGDPWICILQATLGAALALLGPGAFSVDARLFGRKRINLQE